jgi:methionyl-tRNA formyltransferase
VRILLVGQAAFAEQVLQGLEAAGHDLVAVVCPPDRGDKTDPAKAAAIARGIATHQFPSLKTSRRSSRSASGRCSTACS